MVEKYVVCIALAFLALIPVGAAAQETDGDTQLPDPGITPDSWMYGFKKAFENVDMALTFGEEAKAKKHLHYAELRLSEANNMAEKRKTEHIDDLSKEYQNQVEKANRFALSNTNGDANVNELVANATAKHIQVLERVRQQVPDQAKESIDAARENSMRGNQEALRALAKDNPQKAAKIAMEVAKGRVEKARQTAHNGQTEEAAEAAQEYSEYARLGEEIANMSTQMGKNPLAVKKMVENATSIHQIVLKNVLEKVPPQAQSAIEEAINKSKTGQEEVTQALNKTRGVNGDEMDSHNQTLGKANTTTETDQWEPNAAQNTTHDLPTGKPEQGQVEP
ncbi:MAG: DUF5667 domain-containing protein [Archaeoglobaceae archaeon]